MEKVQELKFPKQRATVPLSVVLSQTETGYATHLRDYTFPGNQGKMHGHYFDDLISAQVDYDKRCETLFSTCRAQGLITQHTLIGYRASADSSL